MASVSKTFTATAIFQLVERGKMDLRQPIISILPYFKMEDRRYEEITPFHILNHTSGMPDVVDYEWNKPQFDDGAAERYVRSLATKQLLSEPGEKFAYSNVAFDLLGDVIAKVSGTPFEDYIKVNILDPLLMKESNFLKTSIKEELAVSPHTWDEKFVMCKDYPYNRRHAPSSTLNSNVIEMSHWMIANLNHGQFRGHHILNNESHRQFWQESVRIDSQRKMGVSWFLETYKGTLLVSHAGCDTGFRSHLALLPEKQLGFVLMSNCDRKSPDPLDELITEILDLL